MAQLAAPASAPAAGALLARARGENFPVAIRLLGRRTRADLLAIYGFARLVDELGDAYQGDRLQALEWAEAELDRAFAGTATHPIFAALTPTLRARRRARGPFARLIEANRLDQRVSRYDSWEQLRGSCSLSADPVGQLVLGVFGVREQRLVGLSDLVCTALQLTEHCQDVAEDLAAGRIYMPAQDLARFGVTEADLAAAPPSSAAVRALLAFEVDRARGLLEQGAPLIDELTPRAALAVAAFIAGARAALSAIERADYEVLGGAPRASRRMLARALAGTLGERALRRFAPRTGRSP